MATYSELYNIGRDAVHSELRNRVAVAATLQARVIRDENVATPNHANRLKWAKAALENPLAAAGALLPALLADNASLTTAQILGASDAAILSAVAGWVDVFATG